MDALAEVRLRDASLLQSATVLASRSSTDRSSSARTTAPVPLASPPVVPPAAHGESGGLYCDHCGRDGRADAFCYMKKKSQARRYSQGTGSAGSERSSVVQRHRRFSCCFVALRLLRQQELLVL
jgi:hypothetical protein